MKEELPLPGAVFLAPLEDGRCGCCSVLRDSTNVKSPRMGLPNVLVAACNWIGAEPPSISDRELRSILHLNHHGWEGKPKIDWVFEPPPAEFRFLGVVKPNWRERRMQSDSFDCWENFPLQIMLQWRWDNDREALLAEEAKRDSHRTRQDEAEAVARKQHLASLTLDRLLADRRFLNWEESHKPEVVRASQQIFQDAIRSIRALGSEPNEGEVFSCLRRCIERFNDLNEEYSHFIETLEREQICECFEELVHAAGFGHHAGLADRWREW